jgi:predicted nuclease with TOPRIM domain
MRRFLTFVTLSLSAAVVGCGDTPHDVVRDYLTMRNEVSDEMLRIHGEADAKATMNGRFKKMKDKQDFVKKRLDEVRNERKKMEELGTALEYYAAELKAADAYFERAKNWINNACEEARRQAGSRDDAKVCPNLSNINGAAEAIVKITLPQDSTKSPSVPTYGGGQQRPDGPGASGGPPK